MHNTTFGPQIQYVLIFTFLLFALSPLKASKDNEGISSMVKAHEKADDDNLFWKNTKAIIPLQDTEPPTVNTKDITVQLDSNGKVTIQAEDVDDGSTDNIAIDNYSLNQSNFDCTNIGQNTVTLTVTDTNGNSATGTAIVTVQDQVAPTVQTQDITVQIDNQGIVNITPQQIDNNSTDNCNIDNLSLNISTFLCSDIGPNTVTLTVTDIHGNSASETATVTVEDKIKPSVNTQNITVQLNASGNASVSANQIDSNSTDNCGISDLSLDQTSFDCADVGSNTVTLTVTDVNGNSASKTATVTVEDSVNPTVNTQNITVQLDASGNVSITPEQIDNNSTDNCGISNLSLNQTSFDCADVGSNTVTITVTDVNGNSASQTATVTVEDNEIPVITVESNIESTNETGTCQASLSIALPTVTDNCGSNAPIGTRDDNKGLNDPYPVGTTTITWNVEDANGNIGNSVIQKVNIKDNEAPEAPVLENIAWGCEYTLELPVAQDNCSGEIIGEPNRSTIFTESGTITWTFTDDAGNRTQVDQEINIVLLEQTVSQVNVDCNNSNTGSATATASGGIKPYTYTWSTLGTGANKTGLSEGTYNVTVSDANGCQVTNEVIISQPDGLTINGTTSQPTSCYDNGTNIIEDGSISVGDVSGGTPPYQYSLDNENFQSSTEFTSLRADEYTVFVVDSNGCAFQDFITVDEPDELSANISKSNLLCNGDSSGSINISNPEGGSGEYEYSIDNNTWQSENNFAGLNIGDYSVYIRDRLSPSCTVLLDDALTITEPELLTATATSTRTTAYGSATGSATANPAGGTPGYTYEWRKLDENNNPGTEILAYTKSINNIPAGNYQVTVTDKNGCKATTSKEVIDKVFVEIIASSLCDDVENELRTSRFSINLETIAGGVGPITEFTYSWKFGTAARPESTSGEGEIKVEYDEPGDKDIILTVTDASGISSDYQFIHYAGECFEDCGQSQNFQIDRNSFYIGDESGNILDSDNCSQNIEKFLWFEITKSSNIYALNTELVYTITDENGNTTAKKAIDCFGKDLDARSNKIEWELIPTGLYRLFKITDSTNLDTEIEWSCGSSFEIEALSMRYVTNDKKKCGDTNRNACIGLSDEVGVSTPIIANAQPTDATCFMTDTGSISFSASGGIKPYFYSIDGDIEENYFNTKDFYNLPAGVYNNLWVKDNLGKRIQLSSVEIKEPSEIELEVNLVSDPDCYGVVSVKAEASGGIPGNSGYNYLWNDEALSTEQAVDLSPGDYTVTVTDANGCQEISSITISDPEELTNPEAGDNQELGCGIFSTTLSANTPENGIGVWSIDEINSDSGGKISNNSNAESVFSAEGEGSYTLIWTISNADGECPKTDSVTINFSGDCNNLDFDGVDDYIGMTDNYGFTIGNFTIELWVKPESTTGLKTILSKKDKAANSGGYDLVLNGGSPTFRWGSKSATTSRKLTTTRWHHIAVIFKQNSARLFVDGIDVGNANGTNPAITTAPFLLGAIYDSGTPNNPKDYYSGWMEEIRIWNTALTPKNIRFMMNQRLQIPKNISSTSIIEGKEIPNKSIAGSYYIANGLNLDEDGDPFYNLTWGNLAGYYPLISIDPDPLNMIDIDENLKPSNGTTPDLAIVNKPGRLYNIETNQNNTAPLPYISDKDGEWSLKTTWLRPSVWEVPNSKGIDNTTSINWNIARIQNDISSGKDIKLLGLLSESGRLEMNGTIKMSGDESGTGTGNGLTISHYLKLDGSIDFNGESQLVQPQGSILDDTSNGSIDIDQQGTANSFNYNYWTSPVSLKQSSNNSGFEISSVLKDGTDPSNPKNLDFGRNFHHADYAASSPRKISSYWLYTFQGTANDYFQWRQVSETQLLAPGVGYSMKGTSGYAQVSDRQNYTFRGKPNNGDITVNVGANQNLLTGNPYPSAIDARQFIEDNLSDFNGSIYYWDHFGPVNSHYLEEYVGGYAVYNLSGGISSASSVDSRIDDNGDKSSNEPPGQYIPVGQAFFINTKGVSSPQSITYKNEYRAFVPESTEDSHFHNQEKDIKTEKVNGTYKKDSRYKIRLKFESPKGYHRQILVAADARSTQGFDLGYDAPLIENNVEDMYWVVDETEFVIQAVPNFNLDQVLPIGIKISEPGEYVIKIDELENVHADFNVFLKDLLNDKYFNLSKGEIFKATAEETGIFNDRFEIVFTKPRVEEPKKEIPEINLEDLPIGLQYRKDTDQISIFNPELMRVDFVELYSISGQKIISFDEVPTEQSVLLSIEQKLSSAVYIVKLYSGERSYSKKVIITK